MKIKYVENHEKKTVVAIVSELNAPADEICNGSASEATKLFVEALVYGMDDCQYPMISDIKGVAKCTGSDVYDAKVGRDVARVKAMGKYHHNMAFKYANMALMLEKAANELREYSEQHLQKFDTYIDRYSEYVEEV